MVGAAVDRAGGVVEIVVRDADASVGFANDGSMGVTDKGIADAADRSAVGAADSAGATGE